MNLFKGYLAEPDTKFATYIKQKKNNYEECQDLQEDDSMTMANNRFKALVCIGEWNTPSKAQEDVLALESITKKQKAEKNDKRNKRFEWK